MNAPDECGALHESSDVTGFRCELKPGHRGEHMTWTAVTWPQDAVPVAAGGGDTGGHDAP